MAITIPETGELIEVNRAYEVRSGFRREDLLGRRVCEVNLRLGPLEVGRLLRTVREEGTFDELPAQGVTRTGEVREVFLSGRVVAQGGERLLLTRVRESGDRREDAEGRRARFQGQRAFLVTLAQAPAALAGEIAGTARLVTASCAALLGVARVSVWLFDEGDGSLRCVDGYAAGAGHCGEGDAITEAEFRPEFEYLDRMHYVDICDPASDARAAGYLDGYARPRGVTAILDAAVRLGERNLGILRIEHVGRAHAWEPDEVDFACHVASHLSATLERRERRRVEARLRKAMDGHVRAMATTVEIRDPYTAGHERRVAQLAAAIAREMGRFSEHDVEGIRVAAYMHDLGKIAVPAEILSKPGKINSHEFGIIRTHPQVGYDVLKEIDFIWPIAQATLQHHERLDGSGYPQGLRGEAIIPQARILGVADVVEAMASHRPYRAALSIEEALDEAMQGRDRLYDTDVVDACVRLFLSRGFQFEA